MQSFRGDAATEPAICFCHPSLSVNRYSSIGHSLSFVVILQVLSFDMLFGNCQAVPSVMFRISLAKGARAKKLARNNLGLALTV